MFQEQGLIIFLCVLIVFLLWRQSIFQNRQKIREQHDKIILALLSYPVHHYTMAHMLERCLAIIFSVPQPCLLPKGVIFLLQYDVLNLGAHRDLTDAHIEHCRKIATSSLASGSCAFQFIPGPKNTQSELNPKLINYGHYIVPLKSHDKLIGVLTLYTDTSYIATDEHIKHVKSLSQTITSLIERKQISDELRLGNSVINHSQQAIFITDQHNTIIRCNQACEKITGYRREELIGNNPNIFQSDYHSAFFYKKLWKAVQENGFWQGEIWNKRKDGSIFAEWLTISAIKDTDHQVIQYLAIFTDLSSIKKAEKDLRQLSFIDSLTQLPNRTLFNDRVLQSIAQAKKQHNQFALICLDIDHFKKINESLGYEAGDKLIQVVADRVANCLRKEDSIARVSGDEFAMIIHELNGRNSSKVVLIAKKVLSCLKVAVQQDEHEIIVTGSIGISVFPDDADNAADLMKFADSAMFQAKINGRNTYQFYNEKFNHQGLKKIRYEEALRQALNSDAIEVYLQPQLNMNNYQLTGAEALLRVRRGELSQVSPADFIPVAEESGLIVEIGDWVFAEVCRVVRHWHEQNLLPASFKRIAVNISPIQFNRPDFIKKIGQIIQETGAPVQYLEVELTASSLQESTHSVVDKLIAIKALGINIAIDDFGTGYSSLSRLKLFPIDVMKIDRSFVRDLCSDRSDMSIIKAIVKLAGALDISILAEGIETEAQVNLLKTLQCGFGQGFLFSKPLTKKQFESLLSSDQSLTKVSNNSAV